jgi:hypothetical protein
MGQDPNGQPEQHEIKFAPGLTFQTGQTPDGKCVVQVVACMVVEPGFMRHLARQFDESAEKAEAGLVVPQKPPLLIF